MAGATCQDWEGKAGTRPLTSGGSLKTLSRKRPRLNSISRAEPLATVTRLRWFRENMLAVPCSVRSLRSWDQSPAGLGSGPSTAALLPVQPGISPAARFPNPAPGDDTWAGQGAASSSSTPAWPVLGRQANLGRQFHCQRHPKPLQHGLRASTFKAGLAHLHLGRVPKSPPLQHPHLSN